MVRWPIHVAPTRNRLSVTLSNLTECQKFPVLFILAERERERERARVTVSSWFEVGAWQTPRISNSDDLALAAASFSYSNSACPTSH